MCSVIHQRSLEALDELHKCTRVLATNVVETGSTEVSAAKIHGGMLMHTFTRVV